MRRIYTPRHRKVETHCKKCGNELYYYVDGNNGAINHNQRGRCANEKCDYKDLEAIVWKNRMREND